jgi:hypothetical protein
MAETVAGVAQVLDTSVASLNQAFQLIQQALDRAIGPYGASLGPLHVVEPTVAAVNHSLLEVQRRLARVGLTSPPVQVGEMTTSSVNMALLDVVRAIQAV